ncbi:MAG: hypothetical protein IJX74_05940 [Clostridia bacterium]|nr:hypothetical protein [Clostridia bacterium]
MKKLFFRAGVILCLATLCISLFGCNKSEPTVDMSRVAAANNTEAVLASFDNYYVQWSAKRYGMPEKVLISDDYIYCDDGVTPELYAGDRTYEKTDDTYVATVRFPEEVEAYVSDKYFKAPVIDSGAADEEVLSVTQDDYLLNVTTKLSTDRSKEIAESFDTKKAYSYLKAVYVINRDTLTVTDLTYYCVRSDGGEALLANARIAYDAKGIWDAENMYAHATDTSYEMRTVTIVLDPDTKNERTVGCVARRGDPIALRLGDNYKAVYSNRECTIPYRSDGTYSDNETLYCRAVDGSSAEVKLSDVIAASSTKSILEVFENYSVQKTVGGKLVDALLITKDYMYATDGTTPEIYLSSGRTYEKDGDRYVATVRETADVEATVADKFMSPLVAEGMADDTVLEIDENNYYFYITVRPSAQRTADILSLYDAEGQYQYTKAEYTVNKATLTLVTARYFGVSENGREAELYRVSATYNTEDLTEAVEMYEYVTDSSHDMRTVTVILDPNTNDERTVSATARQGDPIALRLGNGYKVLYTDRECTEVYKSDGTYVADEMLYCPKATE